MKKRLLATVVSLVILLGMAVKADAGILAGDGTAKSKIPDGSLYMCRINEGDRVKNLTTGIAHDKSEKVSKDVSQTAYMMLIVEDAMLNADNTSSTKVTATLHKSTGEMYENADGVIKFSTTLGRMDADKVAMHNGRAENIFYSQDLSDTPQTAYITAEMMTSDKFNGYSVTTTVMLAHPGDVTKESQKITYRSAAIKKGKVTYGSSFSLSARTTGTGKLTYKSSNTKTLSVNTSGKVTVKGYGPVSIKIKAAGGDGYKAAVRKIKLTVVPRQGRITKAKWQKSGVRIQWKPEKTADGYEYAIAYNKKFSGQSRKKTQKTGLILTKYKTGTKQMFIKVRTYKKIGKKTYYGSWSKPQSVKLKKSKKTGQSSYMITN